MWSSGGPCLIFLREEDEEPEADDESDEELDEDGVAAEMLETLQGNEGPPECRPG